MRNNIFRMLLVLYSCTFQCFPIISLKDGQIFFLFFVKDISFLLRENFVFQCLRKPLKKLINNQMRVADSWFKRFTK